MIELIGISKDYAKDSAKDSAEDPPDGRRGATVVDDLSFTVARGEFFVIIGPSGSGKSTTLKMINRLIPCSRGRITLDGEDILGFNAEHLRRRMGYVIQSIGLFPHWTVARNIATVPELLGWPQAKIRARTSELLGLLKLDPDSFAGKYPHQLSGGEQQRIGVARALAARPEVLLMDEPFGALDPIARCALQDEIARIQRDSGTTVVFVTHDMEEALKLGSRIALLDRGRLVQLGKPLALLADPATAFVREFVGRDDHGIRLLSAELVASRLRPGEAAAGSQSGAPVGTSTGASIGASIANSQTLRQALSQMISQNTEYLQVVDGEGRALGALHLSDLLRR